MRTASITSQQADRRWWVVDLEGQTLGRAAARIALVLRGKSKPSYTPHEDTGDFVVVVNADKFKVTGNKRRDKPYYHHSGAMGGLKKTTLERLVIDHPGDAIRTAVAGMLPKTTLGRRMIKKLKVYTGKDHPHAAQQPGVLDLARV